MLKFFNRTADKLTEAEQLFKRLKVAYEKQADGALFVPGDLDLSGRNLAKLPDLSNVTVGGNFNCEDNLLTSLRGAPKEVKGDFNCGHNIMTSRDGLTTAIGGKYICEGNTFPSQQPRAPRP